MAKRKTLIDLLDLLEPGVRDAFLQAIANIGSDTQRAALEAAIRRQDAEAALQVIALGEEYFAPLDRALREAFAAGGDFVLADVVRQAGRQGAQVTARFDIRNPRAERWLQTQSSRLITELVGEQREVIRETLRAGFERGTAPRRAALDLVGRINRATGRREGGIVGLTSQQAQWARNAYDELTSGDPTRMGGYLERRARDRRFDKLVKRAIREGRPLTADEAGRITAKYRTRLLRYRGEVIARTELLGSLHEAQNEGVRQMVDAGKVWDQDVTRVWDSANDADTRPSHRTMDGQRQPGSEGVFVTGNGYRMRYPGDRSLGAPAAEVVNCRCVIRTDIDFVAGLARAERLGA